MLFSVLVCVFGLVHYSVAWGVLRHIGVGMVAFVVCGQEDPGNWHTIIIIHPHDTVVLGATFPFICWLSTFRLQDLYLPVEQREHSVSGSSVK